MPKQVKNAGEFLKLIKGSNIVEKGKKVAKRTVFIKRNASGHINKFKVRKGGYLYTLKADKPNIATAVESGLGKDVEKIEIKKRKPAPKKAKK